MSFDLFYFCSFSFSTRQSHTLPQSSSLFLPRVSSTWCVCVCGLSMAQFSFWKRKTFWMVSVTSVRYVTMAAYQTAQWPLKWHDARTDDGWSSVRSAGRVIFSYIFFFGVCACIVWLYATVIIMWCWHQLRLHRLCTIEYIIFECRSHNNSIWNSYAPAQRDREGGGGGGEK